jgi:four helix bundle protein
LPKDKGVLTRGEFKQFLGHARGSTFELESQILIAEDLEYVSRIEAGALLDRITELGRILNGLLKSLDKTAIAS